MKRQPGLATFAGHDPFEKEIGIGTGLPCSEKAKAIMRSRATMTTYRRLRAAARANPPRPAAGGFPYNPLSVAETVRRRVFNNCRALLRDGDGWRQCRKDAPPNGYCAQHKDRAHA